MADLAGMIQVSIVGYAVGGSFVGLAYFDLFYLLVAVLVLLRRLLEPRLGEQVPAKESTLSAPGRAEPAGNAPSSALSMAQKVRR